MKLGILSIICACYLLRESMGALSLSENLDVTTDSHLTNNDFGEDDMVYFNADITIDSGVSLILDVYTFNLAGNFLNRGYTYIRNFYSLPENYNENRNALYLNFNTDPTSLYDFSNYGTLIVTDNDTSCVAPMYKIGGQTFYNEGNILFADGGICNYANFGLLSLSVINTGVISFFLNEGQLMGLAYLGDAGTTNEVINNGTICMRGGTSSQQSILNANSPISGNGCINVGSSSVFQLTTPDTFGTDGNQMTIFLSSETSVFYISSAIVGAYSFLVKGWGNGNFIADSDFSNSEWTYVGDTLSVAFNNAVVNYIVGYGYDSSLISMEQIDNYGYGLTYAGPPPDSSTPDTCQTCPSVLPQVGEPFIVSDDDDNDEIVTSSSEPSSLTDSSTGESSSTEPSSVTDSSTGDSSSTEPSSVTDSSTGDSSSTEPSSVTDSSTGDSSSTEPSSVTDSSTDESSSTEPSSVTDSSTDESSSTEPSSVTNSSTDESSSTEPSSVTDSSTGDSSSTEPSSVTDSSTDESSSTEPSSVTDSSTDETSSTEPSSVTDSSTGDSSSTEPSSVTDSSTGDSSSTEPSSVTDSSTDETSSSEEDLSSTTDIAKNENSDDFFSMSTAMFPTTPGASVEFTSYTTTYSRTNSVGAEVTDSGVVIISTGTGGSLTTSTSLFPTTTGSGSDNSAISGIRSITTTIAESESPSQSMVSFQITAVAKPPIYYRKYVALNENGMTLVETDGPTFELLGGYITINDLFLEADESNGVYLGDTPFGGWSKVGDPILSLEGFGTEFYICPEQSIPLQLNMIDCNCFIGELHVLEEEPTSVTDGATIAYVSSVCNSGSSSTTAATTATTNDATITTTYTSNEIITITDCPETVTHCPLNSIRTTTVVHTITTIYCPESDGTTTSTSENTHTATGSTITTTFTSNEVIKITDCPETITDCPLNSIRTVTIIHTLTATYWPEVVNNSPEAASPLEIYTTPIVNTKNGGAISTGTGLVAVITNEVGATTATLITSGVQSLYTTTVTNTSCTESYPCTKTAVVVVGSNASGEFTSIVAEGKIESNTAAQINAESIFTNSARTNAIQPNVSNNADITTATTISDVHSTFDTIPYSSTLVSLGPSVSIVDDESGAVANEWKILTSYIVSLIILAFV